MPDQTPQDASLWTHFASLKDKRIERCRKHSLQDILVIAICGFICGVDNWADMELFGNAKRAWFSTFLELPNGIPSHDTFGRVFSLVEPEAFARCFTQWAQAVADVTEGKVVAIDGKAVRRSFDKAGKRACVHLVNAWVAENKLVLGQVACEEKSNEITAVPQLLNMLSLKGCIVTLDAIGCQRAIVERIVEKEADYVIALKGNQETLHEAAKAAFAGVGEGDAKTPSPLYSETFDEGHGRVETRRCWVTSQVEAYARHGEWKGLSSFIMVESERTEREKNETHVERRYFISSLSADNAERALSVIRTHWSVENDLHWSLDVAFREDESRVREERAQQNMGMMRRLALSLLKQDTKTKAGIAARRKKAGWDHDYLLSLLTLRA
jgi:predicted transposase YbfD/YdcC